MKTSPISILTAACCLALLGLGLSGCASKSDDIPTSYNDVGALMQQGWASYNAGNFAAATESFRQANERDAYYLPAYNGLGWSAVRQTNFSDAEVQFSFVTTLASPQSQSDLLADTYAGLSLSSAIQRASLENSGEGSAEELASLAMESISRAQMVFNLKGEAYDPAEHDPGFGSHNLHLLNAQHWFYLQRYDSSEAQLSIVDPTFVPAQLTIYGELSENNTISLTPDTTAAGVDWYLNLPEGAPLVIHHLTQITQPDPTWNLTFEVLYSQNAIQVFPAAGTQLQPDANFIVSYMYITQFSEYLYNLITHIQELIGS